MAPEINPESTKTQYRISGGAPAGITEQKAGHGLAIQNRKSMTITGVTEVIGFGENYIVMNTQLGMLRILGQGLHILRLLTQSGDMSVEGRIDALEYSDPNAADADKNGKSGWLKKLLRG